VAVLTFRDTLRRRSPPWLQHGRAERVLYAIGVQLDAFADALVAGARLRFPGLYSDESLPLIGRERRIPRGRYELGSTYAARLTRWLIDHRRRGGPYALLAQLHAHYAPDNFVAELVYRNGQRYTMDASGAVVRDEVDFLAEPPQLWTPSTPPSQWAMWWLILDWPFAVADGGSWDEDPHGAAWADPTSVWNFDVTPDEVDDLRQVPRDWNAAHTIGRIVLLPLVPEAWNFPTDRFWNESGRWNPHGNVEFSV
jgi:hypothetical protein